MPNIEIHGLPQDKAHDLRLRIFFAFKNERYVGDMVVTVFRTSVNDIKGDSQPYFRLLNDSQEHTEEIIEILKQFGLDIEHLELNKFYPKTNCGCEGSCPVCRLGEVHGHKCNRCGAEFCPKCHSIANDVKSENVEQCQCENN